MGRLTTHVLDLSIGKPAKGLLIELRDAKGNMLASATTNSDGRLDKSLLEGENFIAGKYELRFHVADYFKTSTQTPFLDEIPIAFGIDDATAHYHIPLLLSPYGYSTYRGS
jgi:5-hydroxyisourate hydrolase